MAKDPPPPQRGTDDKLVANLLRKLPHADPSLKGDPERPAPKRRYEPGPIVGTARAPEQGDWRGPWGWVTLSILLGLGLSQWPYAHACGLGLALYLPVVVLCCGVSVRAVVATWRARRARAHIVALCATLWSIALAANVVLPRVGYASEAAGWRCVEPTVIPPPTALPLTPDSAAVGIDSMELDSMMPVDSAVAESTAVETSTAPDSMENTAVPDSTVSSR